MWGYRSGLMCGNYVHMVYIYIMSLIYDRIFCKKHQNGPRNVTEPHCAWHLWLCIVTWWLYFGTPNPAVDFQENRRQLSIFSTRLMDDFRPYFCRCLISMRWQHFHHLRNTPIGFVL